MLLVGPKVEKSQRNTAGPVKQHDHQHGAAPAYNCSVLNPPLDQYPLTGLTAANGVYAGTVFVAAWQVEQQIRNLADAKRFHFVGEFRSYTMQVRECRGTGVCQCSKRSVERLLTSKYGVHFNINTLG